MILYFTSELSPTIKIKISNKTIFEGVADKELYVESIQNRGKLVVQMFDKDPRNQPAGKDTHIKLETIKFGDLVIDENKIYQLYDPVVNNTKTLYLGFNVPTQLEIDIEHPYNKLIKRLALLSER
jgi:hypothetical protein